MTDATETHHRIAAYGSHGPCPNAGRPADHVPRVRAVCDECGRRVLVRKDGCWSLHDPDRENFHSSFPPEGSALDYIEMYCQDEGIQVADLPPEDRRWIETWHEGWWQAEQDRLLEVIRAGLNRVAARHPW
jgi:hypothetical protein